MSVEYVTGNICDFPSGITVFIHGCNRQRIMGAGLARSVREEFPSAFEAYDKAFFKRAPHLGSLIAADVGNGKRIINCITQDLFGTERRYVDYEALYSCLEQVKLLLEEAHAEGRPWVLGIPKWIGGGLAGGNHRVIQAMVESLFERSPIRCVVVELPAKTATV